MVAKLVGDRETIELVGREEWILGRDPDEATTVIADPAISRAHARIRQMPEGLVIENLSQTNPLLINGQELVAPHLLAEGDQLQIGDTMLRFTQGASEPIEDELEEYDAIFGPEEVASEPVVELKASTRWMMKVITGPNSGAEMALEPGRSYLLGTDAASCDVVFHDLSVSRNHARLHVGSDETVQVEDLGSRNGVVVEGRQIEQPTALANNNVVQLGTSSFVLIDREAAQETIVSVPPPVIEEEELEEEKEEEPAGRPKAILSGGTFILVLIAAAIMVVVVVGALSLFKHETVEVTPRNYNQEISRAVAEFPEVRFTFNKTTGKLFLLGHVMTPVDRSEMMYNLDSLPYIASIDDNVIVDQNVWEEYNAIISKNPQWVGVSIHSAKPGEFIMSGYLKTRAQGASLQDYMRLNFPYLEKLQNNVTIEEALLEEVLAMLIGSSFGSVMPILSNGEVTLTGYIGKNKAHDFEKLVSELRQLKGVRSVKNYVVLLADEHSVIDLTGRYTVQGFSEHEGAPINVLIDGQILARGDTFQGMRVVQIKEHAVILEKNGVKYKINY